MGSVKNQKQLKGNNIREIVLEIRRRGLTSKSHLAASLELSFATVSNICNQLTESGLLRAVESSQSTGGRKPTRVAIDPDAMAVITLSLDTEDFSDLHLVNLDGEIKATSRLDLRGIAVFEDLLELIRREVLSMYANAWVPPERIMGLSVVIPGVVNSQTGLVEESSLEILNHVSLTERIETVLNIPVLVQNDANTAAIAAANGEAHQYSHLLYLYFSTGIGLGIVVNGKVNVGTHGFAGELGHWRVTDRPVRCACGQDGCFREVTLPRMLAEFSPDKKASVSDLLVAYNRGERNARALMDRNAATIGQVIGTLVDVFNPEIVYLGGDLAPLFGSMMTTIRANARSRSFISDQFGIQIEPDSDVKRSLVRGSVETVFVDWLRRQGELSS